MKKGLFTLLLLIMTALPALAAPTNTSGPWGIDAGGFRNLSTALASPSTAGKTVVVSKPMTINTMTTDRTITVTAGGRITVASGKQLTMPVPLAGRYLIYDGPGTVILTKGGTVYPEWKGAESNNPAINSGPAIIWAGNTGLQVELALGEYLCDGTPMNVTGWKMRGQGWSTEGTETKHTKLKFINLGTNPAMRTTQQVGNRRPAILENIMIYNGGAWSAAGSQSYGMDIEQTVMLKNIAVYSFALSGMYFHHSVAAAGPYASEIVNCATHYNGNHGVLVGTGANNMTFLNHRAFWNGAPAPGTAPAYGVAGNYNGFTVQYNGPGNPGGIYPIYVPDSVSIVGGDASYNSNYGWAFHSMRRSWVSPGYAESNHHAGGDVPGTAETAHANILIGGTTDGLGNTVSGGLQYVFFNLQHAQYEELGIDLKTNFTEYLSTIQVWYGGKSLGDGSVNYPGPYTNYGQMNMTSVVARQTTDTTQSVFASGNSTTGAYTITPTGTSQIIIGNGTYKATIANNKVNVILPSYADHTAASAALGTGDMYKITGSTAIYAK